MLDLVVFLGQIFTLVLKLGRLEPRWESILWFQVTVSREKSKVHVTAEVQIFGVHWKLGDGFVTQGTSCKWQLAKTTIWKTRFLRNLLRSYDSPIFSGLKTDGFFMVLVSKV